MNYQYIFIIFLFFCFENKAQQSVKNMNDSLLSLHLSSKKSYFTKMVNSKTPMIDGVLEDETWKSVEWSSDFLQRVPTNGEKPTYQTAFKIVYDLQYLYIAVRAYDDEPDKIIKRLSRRDTYDSDLIEVHFDSYFDKRTAFTFVISAAGVITDEAISNNGENWDASWDPIWWGKSNIDELGWTAELKIPLSQLRFSNAEEMIWGLNVIRYLFRKQEWSYWQLIPQNANGWVHLYGELHGLKGIKPQKQLEITPYIVTQVEKYPKDIENPFSKGTERKFRAGIDGKIGVTSDITLDLTLSPDFGQVEADPSQVNLTAFEVFFQERRPFFVESRNILSYPLIRGSTDNLMYSRRIGLKPSHFVENDVSQKFFADNPSQTSILGAVKLTGKNKNGFSFGVMDVITNKMYADIDSAGKKSKIVVEPFSNFFTVRVQQDFKEGKTVIGGIFNYVHRDISETHLKFLHQKAYSSGVDFLHHFDKNRKYYIEGNIIFSHVSGDKTSILKDQTSNRRLFQRPDAHYVHVDSSRTRLTGHGGYLRIGRRGKGNFRYESGLHWRSPNLEINDIGFMGQTDFIRHWIQFRYQILKPIGIIRSFNFFTNIKNNWDFGGRRTLLSSTPIEFEMSFKNLWRLGSGFEYFFDTISNNDLRGGNALRYPQGIDSWLWMRTNSSKKLYFEASWSGNIYKHQHQQMDRISMGIRWRISNAIDFSFFTQYVDFLTNLQYVTTKNNALNNENRYIAALIKQKTISSQIRLNVVLRPNLSIQYYGQPFASIGRYSDYKFILKNAKSDDYNKRFSNYSSSQLFYNQPLQIFEIDENLDGNVDYTFDNVDFDSGEFRQNFVVRWEYIPGSLLFFVWSINGKSDIKHQDNSFEEVSNFAKNTMIESYKLSPVEAHSTFLVKYTYRFRR
jgi:hypothetical protein